MKKKNFKKYKQKKFTQVKRAPAQEFRIENISPSMKGKTVSLRGVVERIMQTAGPTIFYLSDGTGTFALKAFEGGGIRAHEEIGEGDVIKAIVKIDEFRDELEEEVVSLSGLSSPEKEQTLNKIKEAERKRAEPNLVSFLVEHPILDKLKERFIKAATEIRLAIAQNRPIIIRHHNDADGYSAGYVLERAVVPLIEKQHGPGKSAWEFYTRAPCAAPFYEIDDSIKDSARSLSNAAKFSNKMPLVIIADNGSSEQDLFGIQQGKVHGMDFIVVDHHYFEEDVISPEVLVHINPFLVGEDGSHFSAGMLCTELSRFINEFENIEQIAALAGLADRIDIANPKTVNAYVKLAEKQGYSRQLLADIATVIDFVSAKLRFMEAREFIEVVFGHPRDKQKQLVGLMAPYIRDLESKGLEIAKSSVKVEKIGKTFLQILPIEETFPGLGFYPKPGKCVGLLHDSFQNTNKETNLITVGLMNSAMTIRATDDADFSIHDLISFLNEKLPKAFVEGGGHKNAGSINFIPNKKDEVLKSFKESIKKNK